MPWHTVFISHSSKSEEARVYLQAVKEALQGKVNVFLDEEGLQSGDHWREKIYNWMGEAHGAVLLLTNDALKSDFFSLEASILSWRSFQQPDFVFIPVLANIKGEDLEKSGVISQLFLSQIQMIESADPDIIAQQVVKSLDKLIKREKPRTRRQLREISIVKDLKRAGITKGDLLDAGRKVLLRESAATQTAGADVYEKFAHCILDDKADDKPGEPYEEAYDAILKLATDYRMPDVEFLFHQVIPCWVAEKHARHIIRIALDRSFEKRAVCFNSNDRWTVDSYISRSCFNSYHHGLQVYAIMPPTREDALAEIREQVARFFESSLSKTSISLKDLIANHQKLNIPIFFLFNWVPDPVLFKQLREEYKTVTFFIATDGSNELLARLKLIEKNLQELSLDKAIESAARLDYHTVEHLLEFSRRSRG